MKSQARQPGSVEDLIASLEAATTGSRALDVQLAYRLGETPGPRTGIAAATRLPAKWNALGDFPTIAKIMLDEGFSWQSVCDVLDCEAPAYTTSLDAAIPGEAIVFVIRSAKRDQWGAIHKTTDGEEIQGWGATEALARRIAGLKGWKKATEAGRESSAPAPRDEDLAPEKTPQNTAPAQRERRKSVINGRGQEVTIDPSLEDAFAEQEDRDWEILF